MLEIYFNNQTDNEYAEYEDFAKFILNKAFIFLNFKINVSLSITFVDSKTSLEINQKYRNKNYVADVTSFPIFMSPAEVEAVGSREIGDLFICIDEAKSKAIKYEHTLKSEVCFLYVHGFLHLLGYDHENNLEEEKEMFDLQDKILKLGNINYIIKFTEDDYLAEEKIDG